MGKTAWGRPDRSLEGWIDTFRAEILGAYSANPRLVKEHGRQEDSFRTGGYAARQVHELAQNAADALSRGAVRGRVEIHLTEDALYCANEGSPLTLEGLEAITAAYLSDKRGEEMGRFGLGFKSVLGVTDNPAIFSRSVSIGFNREAARERLSVVAPDADSFPILRWPHRLDFDVEATVDPILGELATWAATVVRLPLNRDRDRLLSDLRSFPAEFLLFTDQVAELVLTGDETDGVVERRLTCEPDGPQRRVIRDGKSSSSWMVWHRRHRPSDEALAEVSEAIQREEIRISYAAPLDDTQVLGSFWAFFPLQDQTSARGIHNAPWRVSDDRTTLLDGVFNTELLDVLAQMIVEALPALSLVDDPARHFDYLPARGREAQSEGDRQLTELVPRYARASAVVPNGAGELRRPEEIDYPHFDLRLDPATVRLWETHSPATASAPHSSCYVTTTRKARLRTLVRIQDRPSNRELPAAAWLERLTPTGTDQECWSALMVLFSIDDPATFQEFRDSRVLPDENGKLRSLRETRDLFIRGTLLSGAAGLSVMRSSFVERESVLEWLKTLGFTEVDPSLELARVVTKVNRKWGVREWEAFWDLTLQVPAHQADEILEREAAAGVDLRVRTRSGRWASLDEVVWPGVIEPRHGDIEVDVDYHELHRSLLARLGVDIRPVKSRAFLHDRTLQEYHRLSAESYLRWRARNETPPLSSLHFQDDAVIGPLHLLRRLSDTKDSDAVVGWTCELLAVDSPAEVGFGHINTKKFPSMQVAAPHIWAADRYGLIQTSWGPRRADRALASTFADRAPMLPVASNPVADKLPSIRNLDSLPTEVWLDLLNREPVDVSPWEVGAAVADAATRLPSEHVQDRIPAILSGSGRLVPASEVHVAVTDEESRALAEQNIAHFAVLDGAAAASVTERFGCPLASAALRVEYVMDTVAEPVPVVDRYRGLRAISHGRLDDWEITSCGNLLRVVTTSAGTLSEPVEIAFEGTTVLHVAHVSEADLLAAISQRFELGLGAVDIDHVLHAAHDQRVQRQVAECRAASSVSAKLLALLPVSVLEARLPRSLLETVRSTSGDLGDKQVAELLHHVHGYNALVELKHDLGDHGYEIPERWAGSSTAVAFVRSLGLPVEYAGAPNERLDCSITVLGPPRLNPLHDYQEQLRDQVRDLVRSNPPDRAMLFLPTGAGKTRVTVQALVESIIESEIHGPLLWIAQTEELCEQAVQTWHTVWRELGTRPLTIHRLWDRNEVAGSDDSVCVVVATDAKLHSIRNRIDYEWLLDSHAVVIDEAHGATGAGISATLSWLGIEQRRTARPLLGLTATPFKGRGEEANARLARRFGGNQLDVLGADPYGFLQGIGVLARVEHKVLDGGAFDLGSVETTQFETFGDVPRSVLERVGQDERRTLTLVDHISELDPDWPVLVFTPSVLSAQIVAALLRIRGIQAGAVSGSTPTHERRRTIEGFRSGHIRVLTNCNVLTQGFDAPEVRALYIARPTFSPNAYIQMVGRGLRGPLNGGKQECLVVNVADTFSEFGQELAYREFQYLWEQRGGALR